MKINKLKLSFTLLVVVLLFTSCASTFKKINPDNQEFSHRIETNDLSIEYNPNILKYSRNTRLQKKADKKNISFIIGKFTNKSSDSIDLSRDLIFNIQNKNIKESYSKLKQRPWTYYLALISAGFDVTTVNSGGSTSSSTSAFIGINPWALIYSIPNSIIATVANKKMKKELNKYYLENKVLAPNETTYGLITFDKVNNSFLDIESLKGSNVDSKTYSSKYGSFLIEKCIKYDKEKFNSYSDYQQNLIKCLEKSKLAKNVKSYEKKYKNGNFKILGIHAKHQFGRNSNYLYKVGTWAFYNEDGTIEKLIKYDTNGKEIKE